MDYIPLFPTKHRQVVLFYLFGRFGIGVWDLQSSVEGLERLCFNWVKAPSLRDTILKT